jgi:hypothetical protein
LSKSFRRAAAVFPPLALLLALLPVRAAFAGSGTVELLLDRGAVASINAAELPATQRVDVQPLGKLTLQLQAPETIDFVEGAVQARMGVRLVEVGLAGTIVLRLWPEVDRAKNVVRLRAMRAVGEGPLAALPDFSSLLAPVELQRAYGLVLDTQAGDRTPVLVQIEDVFIRQERLQIKLAMTTRPAAATGSAAAPAGAAPALRRPAR